MGLAAAPVGNGRPATGDSDGAEATQHSPTKKPRRTATGTKLALHTPPHRMRGTKLALLAQNAPFWHVFRVQGELSTAIATNKPRMANFFTLAPTPGRAWRTFSHQHPTHTPDSGLTYAIAASRSG